MSSNFLINLNKLDSSESKKIAESTIETVDKAANDTGNVVIDANNQNDNVPATQIENAEPKPASLEQSSPIEKTEEETKNDNKEEGTKTDNNNENEMQSQDEAVKPSDSVVKVDHDMDSENTDSINQKTKNDDPQTTNPPAKKAKYGGDRNANTNDVQLEKPMGILGKSKPKIGYY